MAKKTKPNPIPKDDRRQFQDLLDYLELLDDAVRFVEEGRAAYYKTMLWVLRALVGKGEQQGGILRRFVAKHGITKVRIIFKGMEGIPPTNPLSKDRIKTLEEYLSEEVILEGVPYTYPEYIWNLASQDAVHPDDTMDAHCACGETLFIGGMTANARQVLSMGRTLASFSKLLVERLAPLYAASDAEDNQGLAAGQPPPEASPPFPIAKCASRGVRHTRRRRRHRVRRGSARRGRRVRRHRGGS
jgi:hypothetical protein